MCLVVAAFERDRPCSERPSRDRFPARAAASRLGGREGIPSKGRVNPALWIGLNYVPQNISSISACQSSGRCVAKASGLWSLIGSRPKAPASPSSKPLEMRKPLQTTSPRIPGLRPPAAIIGGWGEPPAQTHLSRTLAAVSRVSRRAVMIRRAPARSRLIPEQHDPIAGRSGGHVTHMAAGLHL